MNAETCASLSVCGMDGDGRDMLNKTGTQALSPNTVCIEASERQLGRAEIVG